MKKLLAALLVLSVILVNSCQRETSFESSGTPAEGLLQSDATGDCFPKTVAGAYVQGTALNGTSNFITVSVMVTTPGSYTITSDTLNGVHFRLVGTFTSTGANNVNLKGIGTPLAAGTFNFTIQFDGQTCAVPVTFLPTGAGGPAAFSLNGSPNACAGFTLAGNYAVGVALGATNTVTLGVNVTTIGTYSITTTFQGMTFAATGAFPAPGAATVVLVGSGTPTTAGVNTVPVTVGTSTCSFPVTVGNAAAGTLGGGPGLCTPAVPAGTYTAGTPLAASNTVQIEVTVTTPGVYNITTNTQNGVSFSAAGTFGGNGTANVTLVGTGTPAAGGPFTFTVTFGTSTCTFPITFGATLPPDYFPRTTNSNWSYDFDDDFNDSVMIKATASTLAVGPTTYTRFMQYDGLPPADPDSAGYYNKNAGIYTRWVNLADYFEFDDDHFVAFEFIHDDVVGSTWTTAEYSGAINGNPVTVRIKFTIVQRDITVTVNGTPYPNTLVIDEKYEIKVGPSWIPIENIDPTAGFFRDYYSRNIGWILDEFYVPAVSTTVPDSKMEIRRYQVF